MKHRKVKGELKAYRLTVKSIKCGRRDEKILELMEMANEKKRIIRFPEFALGQIGMVGKYCLIWYVAWLTVFVWCMTGSGFEILGNRQDKILLSILPPLLLMLTAGDISRVFYKSMPELEKTTKYSLEQIVMLRLLTMSVSHVLLVLAGILISGKSIFLNLTELLVYGYTPLILAAAFLLGLMRYLKGENLRLAGASIVAGVMFSIVCVGRGLRIGTEVVDIYAPRLLPVWKTAAAVGVIICVLEICILRKELLNDGIGNKQYFEKV